MRSRQRTAAAADLSGCCLVNNITPEGVDVKSGEAVHFTLDVRPLWCYSGMRSAKQMPIWAWIKLRSYLRPVHFFRNVHHGQAQHFQQTVIGGKDRRGLSHLAQLPVETLDGIGSSDQPAHLLGILEISAEIGPIIPPGSGDFRILPDQEARISPEIAHRPEPHP